MNCASLIVDKLFLLSFLLALRSIRCCADTYGVLPTGSASGTSTSLTDAQLCCGVEPRGTITRAAMRFACPVQSVVGIGHATIVMLVHHLTITFAASSGRNLLQMNSCAL